MKNYTYHFESQTLLAQFAGAFNDIIIKKYDNNRTLISPSSGFKVNFVYAPKQRVFASLNTPAPGGISLPVVAMTISNISRDNSRVFNKLDGFHVAGQNEDDVSFVKNIPQPVPINIGVNMSIITKYQADMDQIISNFAAYCDPYVVISWLLPISGTANSWELRSEVLWSGNINLSYPIDLPGTQPFRVVADTNFTIKGWMFKKSEETVKRIYTINTKYQQVSSLSDDEVFSFTDLDSLFLGLSATGNGVEIWDIQTNEGLSAFYASVTAFSDGAASDVYYNSLFSGHANSNFTFTLSGY